MLKKFTQRSRRQLQKRRAKDRPPFSTTDESSTIAIRDGTTDTRSRQQSNTAYYHTVQCSAPMRVCDSWVNQSLAIAINYSDALTMTSVCHMCAILCSAARASGLRDFEDTSMVSNDWDRYKTIQFYPKDWTTDEEVTTPMLDITPHYPEPSKSKFIPAISTLTI